KLMNWIAHTGATPGKKRDRLLLLYQYLDQLGLSDEVEEVDYSGSTSRLSLRQKLRLSQQRKEREERLPAGPSPRSCEPGARAMPPLTAGTEQLSPRATGVLH
ncbi:MAG TPA: hypothetical protein VEL31_24175, partial [Ktedonobacteraceae bacterium]|nr:hypothetical protein [Ktedonobacteraceae bacterium]